MLKSKKEVEYIAEQLFFQTMPVLSTSDIKQVIFAFNYRPNPISFLKQRAVLLENRDIIEIVESLCHASRV
jgi:hypothetical protein